MAGTSQKAWFSLLLGLVVGFSLASRLIMPRATLMQRADLKYKTNGCGFYAGAREDSTGVLLWQPQENGSLTAAKPLLGSTHFLFVGVMTAQKYLHTRAVAAHR